MSDANHYRNDLPEIPSRLRSLPIQNGYPVPWFAAEVEPGKYDFRVIGPNKVATAFKRRQCWICGQKLGTYLAFAIGPMCGINRTTSEPPAHTDCAKWSIQACPFLAQRQEFRRDTRMPEGAKEPAGYHLDRQPGAVLLWIAKSYHPFQAPGGVLFQIGDPVETHWYCKGRAASREEVLKSIDSGYPELLKLAQLDGAAGVRELERRRAELIKILPE